MPSIVGSVIIKYSDDISEATLIEKAAGLAELAGTCPLGEVTRYDDEIRRDRVDGRIRGPGAGAPGVAFPAPLSYTKPSSPD